MLIDKEVLIQALRDSMGDPKELHDAIVTVEEQPSQLDIFTYSEYLLNDLLRMCNPNYDYAEIGTVIKSGNCVYVRVTAIGEAIINLLQTVALKGD